MTSRPDILPKPSPRLLRRDEAAAYVGVSPNTFAKQIEDGLYPDALIREGRLVLWDRKQIDAALDRLAEGGASCGWGDVA